MNLHSSGDAQKLKRDFGHSPAGLVELNNFARRVEPHHWNDRTYHLISLQELSGLYLRKYLPKDNSVRCGAWSGALGPKQRHCTSNSPPRSTASFSLLISCGSLDAANDVFSSREIFLAIQARSPPDFDLSPLVSADSASASRWSPPIIPRPSGGTSAPQTSTSSVTSRQQQAYDLWYTSSHPLPEVTRLMNVDRPNEIKPLSVVWNILAVLSKDQEAEFDPSKLLELVEEVQGVTKAKMLKENQDILERARLMARGSAGGLN